MEQVSHLLSKIGSGVIVGAKIGGVGSAGHQGRLVLLRLGLLPGLLGRLLLLHALVAERGQGAGDLLDLVAGQVLRELLGELLQEEGVVRLLVVGAEDGDQGVAQVLELRLGLRVEEGQGAQVDRLGRVLGVDRHGRADRGRLAAAGLADAHAEAGVAEEVLGVLQVGLLLGAAEALAPRRLVLVLVLAVVGLGQTAGPLRLVLGDALGLGLLVGGGFGVGLRLRLGGLLGLLSLGFGVIGRVPGV